MNNYTKNYQKYLELTFREYDGFKDVITAVSNAALPSPKDKISNAIIIMGFSGNGKSSFVKDFLKTHPEYKVLSVDEVARTVEGKGSKMGYKKGEDNSFGENLIKSFGERLDELTKTGAKIIIDGNYLNLFTRMMLVDTLHEAGYNVNLVDITGQLNKTIENRILDETSKMLKVRITPANIDQIRRTKEYLYCAQVVQNFYIDENNRSFFELQKSFNALDLGIDKYLTEKSSYDEIDSIKEQER